MAALPLRRLLTLRLGALTCHSIRPAQPLHRPRLLPAITALAPHYPSARCISLKAPVIPKDEAIIQADHLIGNFVDHEGVFHGLVHLAPLLASIDRSQYTLVLTNPGDGTPANPPVIKQLTLEDCATYEAQQAARAKEARKKQKKNSNTTTVTKECQITWAIGPNDLGTKMRKVKEQLEKKCRIELTIAGKKGMTKVTREQAEELVKNVEKMMRENGGREWRERQGEIGLQYVMYFHTGPKDLGAERERAEKMAAAGAGELGPEGEGVEGEGQYREGQYAEGQYAEGQYAEGQYAPQQYAPPAPTSPPAFSAEPSPAPSPAPPFPQWPQRY